ncbi:RNA-guided endonuclease TnpB family protein [Rhizobium sp. MHM7A]|uniref:RNA-guided endonuclease InsQ/TnpB family protein n=1 Tax=Rhizobium sp. MHM7A TaxID=2583233 RepID=UPI001106DE65|nr:RNA-guided endonuclease TnpB family protein [Rhizobium sp. MHM7A]TLX16851.1 IS200/IS605 family element transposase accessory protein TnpB [Rhizobium sp. MHM7A]
MLLTYRLKLAPTKAQYAALERLCEDQRRLYNAALQERVEAWKRNGISITKLDQFKSLTQIRSFDETYSSVPVAMSRWSIARVDDAFKGFFSRVKRGRKAGFPRFKPRSRWKSFGFSEWDGVRLRDGKLLFRGLTGGLKVRLHRPIPDDASLKACTFTRTGRFWFIAIQIDVPVAEGHAKPDTVTGIDVGVEHLATLSDGTHIENPKVGVKHQRKVRIAQRALARCKRGSKRRAKVREKLALLKRKTANARSAYLHQVSAKIAKDFAFIAVEKLNVKNMTGTAKGTVEEPGTNVRQKAGLNRAMLDAAVSRLISFVDYKAERAGGQMVKVNPYRSSQECYSCGAIVRKTLKDRQHRCKCGADLHRDFNSAIVILERALSAHGRAMPPWDGNAGGCSTRRPGKVVAEAA